MAIEKVININFIGFWRNFNKEDNFFSNILRKRYKPVISDKPDFVIVSSLCKPFEYMKFDCVRILYSGEPLHPDFNAFDYVIGFDNISFDDRYLLFPYFLLNKEKAMSCIAPNKEIISSLLLNKEYFCNFIYSHESPNGERSKILDTLSKYKRVECPCTYKNNMPDNWKVQFTVDKVDFIKRCKFTIAFESFSHAGFLTEKIRDAFVGNSIPIYYGDPNVDKVFNEKAFINCNNFSSFDDVLQKVIEIDNDDDMYIKMISAPKYVKDDYVQIKYKELEEFLFNIFDQSPKNAFRRYKEFAAKAHEENLKEYMKIRENELLYRIVRKLCK